MDAIAIYTLFLVGVFICLWHFLSMCNHLTYKHMNDEELMLLFKTTESKTVRSAVADELNFRLERGGDE